MLGLRCTILCRHFHVGGVCKAATDKASLSKLRKRTGFPFIKCKNALQKFDNDLKQAEAWMREEAQKEGWAKATKLHERPMSHGLVGILQDNHGAAMVEMNCETDFVARNVQFRGLVSKAASACLKHGAGCGQTKLLLDKQAAFTLETGGGKTLADLVALEVGNIGENMRLRRAVYMAAASKDSHVGFYVHSAGQPQAASEKCRMGKYGALIAFSQSTHGEISTDELGRQLAQHVVGMNPTEIGTVESEDESANEMEKKDEEAEKKGTRDGETKKEGDEEEEVDEAEEIQTSMVLQEFLLDSTLTVNEFLVQNETVVTDFVRYECGEVITGEEEDAQTEKPVQ